MEPNQSPWESFLKTGKIDDYLEYCMTRKQEMFASAAGGAVSADATDNKRDRTARPQDRG